METQLHKYEVEDLQIGDVYWFVNVAAVNMLQEELKREELINIPHLYNLTMKGVNEKTAFVVKKDGILVGALGSLLVPNLFNPEYSTLAEIFWYVLPEHRNSRAGLLLLNAFERRACELADDATLSLLGSSAPKPSTLEKRGFILSELAFRKVLKDK